MIRVWVICAFLGAPLAAQTIDEVYALALHGGQDSAQFADAVALVFPTAKLTISRTAKDLPNKHADPDYFYFNWIRWGEPIDAYQRELTAITCSQFGRASLERLIANPTLNLDGETPNFRYTKVPIRDDAQVMLSCLFQFQTGDPFQPFVGENALNAIAAFPGITTHLSKPDTGTTPGEVGWANWWERQSEQSKETGLVVSRLGFLNGFLGQDVQFVAQRISYKGAKLPLRTNVF